METFPNNEREADKKPISAEERYREAESDLRNKQLYFGTGQLHLNDLINDWNAEKKSISEAKSEILRWKVARFATGAAGFLGAAWAASGPVGQLLDGRELD